MCNVEVDDMVNGKKWVLVKEFEGDPLPSNFKLEDEVIPEELPDGAVLCEAVYLSVDPYMRIFPSPVGEVAVGEQVARITSSRNPLFPIDTFVTTMSGWRTHTVVCNVDTLTKIELEDLPLSLSLGILGMPGMTAYFGFLEVCHPKPGETVLVSAAAGAVGSVVGQIAKIKGCNVIGSAGTEEKCRWLKDDLGFDVVFNYKTQNLHDVLTSYGKGVDCYFDNIGGDYAYTALTHMNKFGRVAVCGTMSQYTGAQQHNDKHPYYQILLKQLKVQGIMGWNHVNHWPEGKVQMEKWIKEGKMKYRETITDGFENTCTAFIGLFKGVNIGKAVVKV